MYELILCFQNQGHEKVGMSPLLVTAHSVDLLNGFCLDSSGSCSGFVRIL